jgi:hypothetical protein
MQARVVRAMLAALAVPRHRAGRTMIVRLRAGSAKKSTQTTGGIQYTMVPDTALGGITGANTYHWTQLQNILRDPFETTVGAEGKSITGYGGNLAAPSAAYLYNWNMLPIGQMLWLKELESYVAFPPMQDPASYNLTQVIDQIKRQGHRHPSE